MTQATPRAPRRAQMPEPIPRPDPIPVDDPPPLDVPPSTPPLEDPAQNEPPMRL